MFRVCIAFLRLGLESVCLWKWYYLRADSPSLIASLHLTIFLAIFCIAEQNV
jgi:hypothetical protein